MWLSADALILPRHFSKKKLLLLLLLGGDQEEEKNLRRFLRADVIRFTRVASAEGFEKQLPETSFLFISRFIYVFSGEVMRR